MKLEKIRQIVEYLYFDLGVKFSRRVELGETNCWGGKNDDVIYLTQKASIPILLHELGHIMTQEESVSVQEAGLMVMLLGGGEIDKSEVSPIDLVEFINDAYCTEVRAWQEAAYLLDCLKIGASEGKAPKLPKNIDLLFEKSRSYSVKSYLKGRLLGGGDFLGNLPGVRALRCLSKGKIEEAYRLIELPVKGCASIESSE